MNIDTDRLEVAHEYMARKFAGRETNRKARSGYHNGAETGIDLPGWRMVVRLDDGNCEGERQKSRLQTAV